MMSLTTQAKELSKFFNQFATAYVEDNVPIGSTFPYITYSISSPNFDSQQNTVVRVYSKGSSLVKIFEIADKIAEVITDNGIVINNEEGAIYFTKGSPFCQFLAEDDDVKSLYINLTTQVI